MTSARRVRLVELDALTDRIPPLLARLNTIWRRVEQHLREHSSRAVAR